MMPAAVTTVLVVRHARPVIAGTCYGQSDVDVELPADIAAARVIATQPDLAVRVDSVWTSPLQRSHDLAQALGIHMKREVRIDPRLAELNFGQWEGRRWDEVYRNDGPRLKQWAADSLRRAPPGGETGFDLVARVALWLKAISQTCVLAVTHAGPIRALRALEANGLDNPAPALDFERKVDHLVVEAIHIAPNESSIPYRNACSVLSMKLR